MNRYTIALFAAWLGLLFLGFSDAAKAQSTITVSPPGGLVFTNVPSGSLSPIQTLQVSTPTPATVLVQADSSWLVVNHAQSSFNTGGSGFPTTLPVEVSANGLAPAAYTGSFTLMIQGRPASLVTINVSANVTTASALSASLGSVSFAAQAGANVGNPASVPIQISSSAGTLNYTSTARTQNGQTWLLLTNPNGTTGGTPITASVNPSGLAPATYTGTINVQSTTTSDSVQINVSLTVTASATLSVTPATLAPFLYQVGGAVQPSTQTLMVSASGGSLNFAVAINPPVQWLIPTPASSAAGSQPVPVTLAVNPTGLQPGAYSTSITITPSGGSALPSIPVTLLVSNNPLLQLSAVALSFTAQFAGQPPASQQVQVGTTSTSTNTSVGFTATSDSTWLAATPSGPSAPATMAIDVNPQGLMVGNYTGTIAVRPTNGDQYAETIVVSLAVTQSAQLVAGPPVLLFSYQTTQPAPQPQLVQLTSLSQPASFALSTTTSNCGTGWLSATASSLTTPSTVTVSVQASVLPMGACSGTVTLTYNPGGGTTTLSIPVTVDVSNTPVLAVAFPLTSTGFGVEIVQQGAAAIGRSIPLTSTDPTATIKFSAIATSSGPSTWLLVGSSGSQTPQSLSVQIVPAGLPLGTYSGSIVISSATLPSGPLTIPVTLIVNPNTAVSVAPQGSLSFTQALGGPLPPPQVLTLTSAAGSGATFTATAATNQGGGWLLVSPPSGAASGQINVSLVQSAIATLAPGTYTGQITLAFQNAATPPVTIPVNLTIAPPETVSTSSQTLTFSSTGGQAPHAQTLAVTSTGGVVQFNVGITTTGGGSSWLSVTPASGSSLNGLSTPQNLSVTVNPQGLAPGVYGGTISITAPGVLATPIPVSVTFTVTGFPPPQPVAVTSNASNVGGAIAPGEPITIKGTLLGPSTPALFTINAQGGVNPTLAGVQVLFDGIPGTPIYVSATQINVTVPYDVAGRLSTSIVVAYQGQQSTPIQQGVASVAPAIYTLDSTGLGQAAAINQDGTVNGPAAGIHVQAGMISTTPAPQGSIIALYATGGGQTSPPSTTGSVAPTSSPLNLLGTVSATVGGQPATVLFAGSAPGLVTGVIQVNVQLPPGVTGSVAPIVLTINGVASPPGVTVAIQ